MKELPAHESVYATRDRWKGEAQEAWQQVAEFRSLLPKAMTGALTPEDMEHARVLMEKTKP